MIAKDIAGCFYVISRDIVTCPASLQTWRVFTSVEASLLIQKIKQEHYISTFAEMQVFFATRQLKAPGTTFGRPLYQSHSEI